ncbi:MAG: T9SS type A sorting domain-containing protein, partial [Bacteroidota bacterium]
VSVEEQNELIPESIVLNQNYPNPFNPSTKIKYSIPNVERDLSRSNRSELKSALQNVTLKVYDILGRKVATLVNEVQEPGNYEVRFDASDLSSGMYFYKLTTSGYSKTMKMMLVR